MFVILVPLVSLTDLPLSALKGIWQSRNLLGLVAPQNCFKNLTVVFLL